MKCRFRLQGNIYALTYCTGAAAEIDLGLELKLYWNDR